MLFSSSIFLFLFLPLVLLFHYVAPKKLRNLILLLASLAFYTWGEQKMVILIIFSAFVDYTSGILIARGLKKIGLGFSIFFNIGILLYFKYASFLFDNLIATANYFQLEASTLLSFSRVALPLGISFYTFQTMSYTIDVYRGNVKASRNFLDFATYVTLFPQLVAGPIVRYKEIEVQLKNRKTTVAQFSEGVRRFIIGLGKKMIIANNLAFVADGAFELPIAQMSTSFAWIGILMYTFQIYFDFSGYSDMAIGLGKMLGFNFPENFDYPYIAKSVKEFWRRWHITLSTWFRDYLYISLGGNRKSIYRTYINLGIVFLITGLWHGARWNFIIWGLWHGLFLILERASDRKFSLNIPNFLKHIYALFVVTIGWVLFRAETLSLAFSYLKAMFIFTPETMGDGILNFYLRKESILAFVLAILFSVPVYKKVFENNFKFSKGMQNVIFISEKILLLFIFIISCMYIAVDAYNPFIYFRF